MSVINPRLRAQLYKEFLSILRDPRSRLVLVVPPLLQLVIFSFAVTLEVRNARIGVYDADGGRHAQELLDHLRAAPFVGELHSFGQRDRLQDALEAREILLAIELPPTFSAERAAGRSAPLQVLGDGRRANSAQVALSYIQSLTASLEHTPGTPPPSDLVAVRYWYNPNLSYRWFVVPALAGILTTLVALLLTSLTIARERELGTFDQLLVSPCTRGEIILAKTLPAIILGSALGCVMVGAALFLFAVPYTGSVLALLLGMPLYVLSVAGLGLMVSSVSSTQQQAILGAFALTVPMVLLSGFATPIENMPPLLQALAELVPLKHFLIVLQGSFLKGASVYTLLDSLWPLALIAGISLGAATLLVNRRMQ